MFFVPFKKDQNNLNQFDQYGLKMETIFMNTENSKTNKPHRFRLSLVDKYELKDTNKDMALTNLCIFAHGKTLNQHTTTINLKFIANME